MANILDAYIPELWANESLMILEDNIVAASMVYRDFENQMQTFGDTVNTRKPAAFTAKRKTSTDDVTDQDATATNVPVRLDQHVHVSFVIRDEEQSKSFKNLVAEYLEPAIIAQARFLDQVVLGQYGAFMGNMVPGLGSISSSNAKSRVLSAREIMNINKVPESGRNIVWAPKSETQVLNTDLLLGANTSGDGGRAMREAALGRKLGFDNYMSQLSGSLLSTSCDLVTGAVNHSGGYAKGTTSLVVDGFSGAVSNGQFLWINGDLQRVVSHTETSSATTGIVVTPGLQQACADNDVIYAIDPGAVNFAAGYAAGYAKEITFDGVTNSPAVGQMVSFTNSSTAAVYTIIDKPTSTTMVLDRPLETALSDNDVIHIGPYGDYNFAFHRNAIALVVRPLAAAPTGLARSAVINNRGLSMRTTMTYDGKAQGLRVTLDMLCGVKVLDTALGCIIGG